MPIRDSQLRDIAREVVWWEAPEVTLSDQDEFLGHVMAKGSWDNLQLIETSYGEPALRVALRNSKPGVIDAASWHYWHNRLGIEPVPEMPKRTFA
jgi:hypothetical protein